MFSKNLIEDLAQKFLYRKSFLCTLLLKKNSISPLIKPTVTYLEFHTLIVYQSTSTFVLLLTAHDNHFCLI